MSASADSSCRICTIQLEALCYRRAWWFRVLREILATGIRLSALVLGVDSRAGDARSPMCRGCLRFRKNVLKRSSTWFDWADSYLNPLFNRARDSLLTPEELARARLLAERAAARDFAPPPGRPALDAIS